MNPVRSALLAGLAGNGLACLATVAVLSALAAQDQVGPPPTWGELWATGGVVGALVGVNAAVWAYNWPRPRSR